MRPTLVPERPDPALQLDDTAAPHSLRLALVTETYPPEINGVAMTVARLVDGLRERGHQLQLVGRASTRTRPA